MVLPVVAGGMMFSKPQGATPLQIYGSNVKWYYDAALGVANAGTTSATWTDQKNGLVLSEDTGTGHDPNPAGNFEVETNYFGTRPAIQFRADNAADIGRLAQSGNSAFDNIWTTGGIFPKNLAFAARKETMDWEGLVSQSTLVSKGRDNYFPMVAGWTIRINPNGNLEFEVKSSANVFWKAFVPGYYKTRTEVIGHITFDGLFDTTPNIQFRLWSGSNWQTPAHVFTGNSIVCNDTNAKFCIGNNEDATFRENWAGGVGMMWFTSPALTSINETFLNNFT